MSITSSSHQIEQALAVAKQLTTVPWRMSSVARSSVSRWVAMGDPQAPLATYFTVLAEQNLLGDDGMLAPNVSLLSIGDHFDYATLDPAQSGYEGYALLRWLAEHPPEQAIILLGNHDIVRVQELIEFSDEGFAKARTVALKVKQLAQIYRKHSVEAREIHNHFYIEYPSLAKPGLVGRDYNSYSTAQRDLVMRLLLDRRCQLAEVGRLANGREVLITHAGVTLHDLPPLGLSTTSSPAVIASRLNSWLFDNVERVRSAWERGDLIPLDLSPLHVAGGDGQEGGGLLYHRPSNPDRPPAPDGNQPDRAKEFYGERPRRFHPRDLPPGLIQACGHTGHRKCLEELVPWVTESARAMHLGGLRTLHISTRGVEYKAGVDINDSIAALLMIDGEMNHLSLKQDYALLGLTEWPYHSCQKLSTDKSFSLP